MNKIKVLSLFSGIGAFEKALSNIGIDYELVGFSEIDKFAIKSYCAIHNVSDGLNLGDISKINIEELPRDIDIITHGSPCFTGDTLVLTQEGYKNIKDVKIGDLVLDHTNNYSKVTNFINQGKKEIWKIKAMAFDEIKTTENHKFLTREKYKLWDNDKKRYARLFGTPKWKECKYITKDDYLGIAINQNSKMPEWEGVECTRGKDTYIKNNLDFYDERFWYLCGRFLGDGWIRKRKERNNHLSGVIICCGKHEDKDFENKIGNLFNYTKVEERTVYKYQFSNKELATFLNQFGKGAANKFIPGFVYDLPVKYLEKFLNGYFESDGSNKNGSYKATSISKKLIYGIGQCVAKVYKRPYAIYKTKRNPTYVIEGRVVNQKDTYQIVFKTNKGKQDQAFYEDSYIWFPIKEIVNTYEFENTYDITVEKGHSFTANGCIVHNCQDYSTAGKQKGGDKDSGTRSSLMWYSVEIIKYCKPKYVIWENVKNVLSKRHKHNFEQYIKDLEDIGYTSYYKILNAKDFGIPQNRERVYCISIHNDMVDNFEFPKGENLTVRLKDILEDTVDEKYYLSEEKVKNFTPNEKFLMNSDKNSILDVGFIKKSENGKKHQSNTVIDQNCLMRTLTACDWKSPQLIIDGKEIQNEIEQLNEINPELIGGIGERNFGKQFRQGNRVYSINTLAMCITSNPVGNAGGNSYLYSDENILSNFRIRKLTPLECWRLMGFSDEDFYKAQSVPTSNTQLYKQAGNSIVVNVLEEIFKSLFKIQ